MTITAPTRRRFIESTAALGLLHVFRGLAPVSAQGLAPAARELRVGGERAADIVIARTPFSYKGRTASAVTMNGTLPGPILRFREGETVTLRVANRLDDRASIHWHGVIVPSDMDGVPGVSFPGIEAGKTFTYRYRVRQNGTYWYHSHSAFDEQLGQYGPLLIDPPGSEPFAYDREHVVMLSDWTFRDPRRLMSILKKESGSFNFQQRTLSDFTRDAKHMGLQQVSKDRAMWGRMRMDPTDILDVTGAEYTYLVNGMPPDGNWTGLFKPGERVRLRFINGSSGTYFNVRIPGLDMTVVQADGQNVEPVDVAEFQIAVAETYDVIVSPRDDRAFTIFAESMDRSGYARGTLAPRSGMGGDVPSLRARPLRSMVDMGMDMKSMVMPGMQKDQMKEMEHGAMKGMAQETPLAATNDRAMPRMGHVSMEGMHEAQAMSMRGMKSPINGKHGPDTHGPGNAMVAMVQRNRLGEPGTGLENVGHKVLTYNDLKALEPNKNTHSPAREIEMHLTGNMEAFIWGIDGLKFSESGRQPTVRVGERIRLTMVNDTMMEHPMHLHGVFMELDNGGGAKNPRKHTVNVMPAERLSVEFTYDEPGNFAFHCHILYHMEAGMFRFFNVAPGPSST